MRSARGTIPLYSSGRRCFRSERIPGTSSGSKKNFSFELAARGVSEKSCPARASTPSIRFPSSWRERVTNSSLLIENTRPKRRLTALSDTHNLLPCRSSTLAGKPTGHQSDVVLRIGQTGFSFHLRVVLCQEAKFRNHDVGRTSAVLTCHYRDTESQRFQH